MFLLRSQSSPWLSALLFGDVSDEHPAGRIVARTCDAVLLKSVLATVGPSTSFLFEEAILLAGIAFYGI